MKQVVRIMCPNLQCLTVLAVPEDTRGKTVRCRNCGSHLQIPEHGNTATTQEKTSTKS